MLIQSFSGIRGVYGKDLTEDIARRYGYVFNEFLKQKLKRRANRQPLIVVGYDTRASSEALKQAMFDSLWDIIDVGIIPIAAAELAVRKYKADGGIMITASHNEPEYNGFKFLDGNGIILGANDINSVIKRYNKISTLSEEEFLDKYLYKKKDSGKIKRVFKKNRDLVNHYSHFLTKIVGKIKNNKKIIIDVNGSTAIVLGDILNKLRLNNIELINNEAGKFKRAIEPTKASLKYLKRVLQKKNAEFAVGFDCDADRIEILLKDGSLIDGNYLLALIADDILSRNKGIVVTNDATSNIIREIAKKYNSEIKEVEVGEINVVNEMIKLKSPVGGEGSNGGIIIPPSKCRDGILSFLYLLRIINKKNKSLKDLIKELPKYYTIQKKIKFDKVIGNKALKNKIKDYYSKSLKQKYKFQETGGVSGGLKVVINQQTFVWFRSSKTEQNLLRVVADSNSKKECNKILSEALLVVHTI